MWPPSLSSPLLLTLILSPLSSPVSDRVTINTKEEKKEKVRTVDGIHIEREMILHSEVTPIT